LKNRHFFNSPEQKSVSKTRNSDWIQKKLRIERFRNVEFHILAHIFKPS